MEGDDKKYLIENDYVGGPPWMYDDASGVTDLNFYQPPAPGLAPSVGSQPYQQHVPVTIQQPAMHVAGQLAVHHVDQGAPACDREAEPFEQEECFAMCVLCCWCRPIGKLANNKVDQARRLYTEGEYEQAMETARCANIYSAVGFAVGILVCVLVGGAFYLAVRLLTK